MKTRLWVLVSLTGVALAGIAYSVHHTGKLEHSVSQAFSPLSRVEVEAIATRPGPTVTASVVRQQTQKLSDALDTTPALPAAPEPPPVTTVRYSDLVHKLKQSLSLTEQEEGRVQGVFKTASVIQSGIDAEQSAENRRLYHEQLVQQVVLRLKLILKDEQRLALARAELQGLPRLELGE